MFTTYKNINELENAYDEERKQLNDAFNQIDELTNLKNMEMFLI